MKIHNLPKLTDPERNRVYLKGHYESYIKRSAGIEGCCNIRQEMASLSNAWDVDRIKAFENTYIIS